VSRVEIPDAGPAGSYTAIVARIPKSGTDDRLQFIEFKGKYDLLLPGELSELTDDELVALVMKRAEVDESRAREILATVRKYGPGAVGRGYDRV
jgi:hypothetical protein